MTIKENMRGFEHLKMKCDSHEDEEQSITHYLDGQNLEIANVISLQQYFTMDDVAQLAMKVEKQLMREMLSM